MYRQTSSELVSSAFHESGHALAIVLAFRKAKWLPHPPPSPLVASVEIAQHEGEWSGACRAQGIYSMRWPIDRIAPRFRELMEWQIVIELAGGVAEALYNGETRNVQWHATRHCGAGTDRKRAAAVLADLYHVTGVRYEKQPFAERAARLLSANWSAVTAPSITSSARASTDCGTVMPR